MAYRSNNYSFVIDAGYNPFSLQELLTPFVMYKQEYDKQEAAYQELAKNANQFKYLSETLPDNSQAKKIYEGYANELEEQARDLSRNGLSINNGMALTGLKRRYEGEIGRLVKADTALKQEQALRRQMATKDPSMLYADENLNIDAFLDNQTPNLYSVSGEDLRKEAAQYAQVASSRVYGNAKIDNINKYFLRMSQEQGYSPELLNRWRQGLQSIPEFSQAVDDIIDSRGLSEKFKDNPYALQQARQYIVNGIMEGSVYQNKQSVQADPSQLTAAQEASNALSWATYNESVRQHDLQMRINGYDPKTGEYLGSDMTPSVQKAKAIAEAKNSGKSGTGTTKGAGSAEDKSKKTISKQRVRLTWNGNDPARDAELANSPESKPIEDEEEYTGSEYSFEQLPPYAQEQVMKHVGNGKVHYYHYYFKPFKGGIFNDTEAELDIVPKSVIVDSSSFNLDDLDSDSELE